MFSTEHTSFLLQFNEATFTGSATLSPVNVVVAGSIPLAGDLLAIYIHTPCIFITKYLPVFLYNYIFTIGIDHKPGSPGQEIIIPNA